MVRTNTSIYVNFPALFPETAIVCLYPAAFTPAPVEPFHKSPRSQQKEAIRRVERFHTLASITIQPRTWPPDPPDPSGVPVPLILEQC